MNPIRKQMGSRIFASQVNHPALLTAFSTRYCWGQQFDKDGLRDAARYAMSNLDQQTRYEDDFQTDCTDVTDIVWREFNLNGVAGRYDPNP